MDPRNAQDKKLWTHKIPEKNETHEIPTRKNAGPMKHPREKIADHNRAMARWHETHETNGGTRPMALSTLVIK